LLLPTIVSQLGTPLTVLDFGGGPARGLISIIDHVRGIDMSLLRYVIVETPAQCRAFEQHKVAIEIRSDIPEVLPTPLVVNAASVFQYIPDWRRAIAQLAHLKPTFFGVSQTPVSDQPTYARLQLNIPGKRIAQWVFKRSEFTGVMSSLGYELKFTADHDLPITHARAPSPSQMTSMVFQRTAD
jgi:putative methyltransferase (TIGR04325 family)